MAQLTKNFESSFFQRHSPHQHHLFQKAFVVDLTLGALLHQQHRVFAFHGPQRC